MGEERFPGAEGERMVGGFHSWFCISLAGLHFLGSLVSQVCVTEPLEKQPSQHVLQHLGKAINPILMGLLLRNAECKKILLELSRPEDAPHLWKHIHHAWLRNYLTPKLPVIDLNITKVFANLLYQDIDWVHGNTMLFSQVHLVHSWAHRAFLPVGAEKASATQVINLPKYECPKLLGIL